MVMEKFYEGRENMTTKSKIMVLIATVFLVMQIQVVLYADAGSPNANPSFQTPEKRIDPLGYGNKLSVKSISTSEAEKPAENLPNNFQAVDKVGKRIQFEWEAPSDSSSVAGYNIYRDGELIVVTSATRYKDTGLSQNTTYKYEIKTINNEGVESEGKVVYEVTTPLVISKDTDWTASDSPIVLKGGLIVEKGATLNIGEGVLIKIKPQENLKIKGQVIATGSEENKIIFTSTNDPDYGGCGINSWRDYWNRIVVYEDSVFSGNHVILVYGNKIAEVRGFMGLSDSEVGNANALGINVTQTGQFNGVNLYIHDCCVGELCRGIYTDGIVKLTDCTITDCPGKGIEIGKSGTFNGTMVNISNCGKGIYNKGVLNLITSKVEDCEYGLYFDTDKEHNVVWNSFISNNKYGVYNNNAEDVVVDASSNYWGSTAGPSVYNKDTSKWEGDGDRVGDGVLYDEWLEEPIM